MVVLFESLEATVEQNLIQTVLHDFEGEKKHVILCFY